MRDFTVISLCDGTGEVFADFITAEDPPGAIKEAAKQDGRDQILCAIYGEHGVVCACEDSGKAAYAEDLR